MVTVTVARRSVLPSCVEPISPPMTPPMIAPSHDHCESARSEVAAKDEPSTMATQSARLPTKRRFQLWIIAVLRSQVEHKTRRWSMLPEQSVYFGKHTGFPWLFHNKDTNNAADLHPSANPGAGAIPPPAAAALIGAVRCGCVARAFSEFP